MAQKSRWTFLLAEISLAFNLIILISVTLDLAWVRTRAAGGQFDEFPVAIRIIYLVMAFAMLYLMRYLARLQRLNISKREQKSARIIAIVFAVSTLTQLISQSSDERWNAIPAVVIAYAFWRVSRVR